MSVTLAELQRRWLQLPAFQRKSLGKTELERTQAFVEQWIVPEMLLAQASAARNSLSNEQKQAIENSVLRQALAQQVRQQSEATSPVTSSDIKDYHETHRQDFDRPERIRVYRILLGTEAEALAVIQSLRGVPDYETWKNLAREKSLDRATNMRGGELGFIAANGKSEISELQVEPILFSAAAHLKDGEIGKAPIREGGKFAVIWRRGHLGAFRASPGLVASAIRAHLRESRAAEAFNKLLTELKAKFVKDLNPSRLDGVQFGEIPSDQFQAAAHGSLGR
jgi:peptidyl-prolyl cis-trans isomerase C